MLISYQKNGDFEFRCPSVEYVFRGLVGETALMYLDLCKNDLLLAEKTIENKRLYLFNFCNYLYVKGLGFDDITSEHTEDFFSSMNYTLASRHNAAGNISLFLRFAYDNGKSLKDTSVFILPDNYKKDSKLPTTYEEDEIKKLVFSVERASAIGKRDYLILLLATEYGWRSKDITKFSFDDIDWDNNVIRFEQHKTGVPVVFPLLSTVGMQLSTILSFQDQRQMFQR
jgi:integrase